MRLPRTCLAVVLLAGPVTGPVLAAGELSVLVDHESGDYGTGLDASTSWLRVRWTTGGDRISAWFEGSAIAADTTTLIPRTIFGPMSGGRHDDGGAMGPGGGSGPGGGPMGATLAATGDPLAATTAVGAATVSESGIGDARAGITVRLAGGGVSVHRLDGLAEVKIPLADEAKGLGTGEWDARFGLAWQYRFWTATGFAGVGYSVLGDPPGFDLDDVADAWAGIETDPLGSGWALMGWLEGRQAVVDGADDAASVGVGVTRFGSRQRWRLLGRVGLTDGAADWGLTLAVSWGVAGKRKDVERWLR
ncbi:MAG: hypothetical protein D6738_02510 [Acidobacteria bacterium]|nr:MAG: hypothetical protein D6738_02510 [Acidobacteriota bacterium]